MVEQEFGYETVDDLLENTDLPSGGIYTAVGTYDHTELEIIVAYLSDKSGMKSHALHHKFGYYLFGTFQKNYPNFIKAAPDAFEFLESIERYIHVEVRKLYPDAELPKFSTSRPQPNQLEMIYESDRRMGHFAHGLIQHSLEHFGIDALIEMKNLEETGRSVQFLITKQ